MFGRFTPVTMTRASGMPSDFRMRFWLSAPAIDAVRLVDHEEARARADDLRYLRRSHHGRIEPLGGAEEELEDAGAEQLVAERLLLWAEVAVDEGPGDLPALEALHLLAHQRLQW